MWLLLVNPDFWICVFLRQLCTMSHTNRFARNQVIGSGARSGQGRAVLCAAKRTLDGEDGRPSIRLRAKRWDRCCTLRRSIEYPFSGWPGRELGRQLSPPPSIRARDWTGTPDATCARLKRLATSLGEANPFYKSGMTQGGQRALPPTRKCHRWFPFVPLVPMPLTDHCAIRNGAALQIAPQINHQSSGQRDDSDAPHSRPSAGKSLLVPSA